MMMMARPSFFSQQRASGGTVLKGPPPPPPRGGGVVAGRRRRRRVATTTTNLYDGDDDGVVVERMAGVVENDRVARQIAELPIKDVVGTCVDVLFGDGDGDDGDDVIVQAPPGAGKTTTIPLALVYSHKGKKWSKEHHRRGHHPEGGVVVVVEPRRVATRAAAARMAAILGERVGETIGYAVRFERVASSATKIEVVTEGVLRNRLSKDPSLRGVSCVVFDEFHERNLDADLSLALVLRAKREFGRMQDLKVCVMSATLGDVATRCRELMRRTLLGNENGYDAPIVKSEGKSFPVETIYVGGGSTSGAYNNDSVEDTAVKTVQRALNDDPNGGNILVFLPGAAEIRRVVKSLKNRLGDSHFEVLPLYGALPTEEQNYALSPSKFTTKRRVVVSTPIAESSLTVPGVTIVVDSGFRRAPKYDHNKGMTRLTTERVSISSADQRRGRAGRIAEGVCYRMWNENSMATSFQKETTPEILTADLTSCMLTIANALDGELSTRDIFPSSSSSSSSSKLAFLDPPPAGPGKNALELLEKLRAIEVVEEDQESSNVTYFVTEKGKAMNALPCHPRIGAMLLFASQRGAASTRLACQLAAGVDSDKSLLRGRDAPLDARSYARAIQGQDVIITDIGSSSSNGNDDEYRKKLGKKVGERGIDVIRVPVDAKLPSSSKRSKKMKKAPKGKKTSAKSAIIDALSKSYNGESNKSSSSKSSFLNFDVDPFAVSEARKSSQQLARNIRSLANDAPTADILRITSSISTDIDADGTNANEPVYEEIFCGAKQFEASVLLAAAFPDRIAIKSRGKGANTFKLSGGGVASISVDNRDDPIAKAEALVICEMFGGNDRNGGKNDIIKLASPLTKSILTAAATMDENLKFCLNVSKQREITWAENSNKVVSREVTRIGDVVLDEKVIEATESEMLEAIVERAKKVGVFAFFNVNGDKNLNSWLKRCVFAHSCNPSSFPDLSDKELTKNVCEWLPQWVVGCASKQDILRKTNLRQILETAMLSHQDKQFLGKTCPESIRLPSGTQKKINYENVGDNNAPVIECRLQELFGLSDTPTVAGKKVELHLLSPASRPVQVTTDLKSFWEGEYENVRKELKGRYPRHYWPENPLEAEPTARAKPRGK
jgi:ATP-dependent helicase HrpB